jgi:hypothetical protein
MRFVRRLTALLLMVTLPAYAGVTLSPADLCPMRNPPAAAMADGDHVCCAAATPLSLNPVRLERPPRSLAGGITRARCTR